MREEYDIGAAPPAKVVLAPGWNGCGGAALKGLRRTFVAHALDEARPMLDEACRAAEDGLHVAGFVAYEAAPAFDGAMRCKPPRAPLVWMAAFSEREAWTPDSAPSAGAPSPVPLPARFAYDPARYHALVETVRNHIREGDAYQVNAVRRRIKTRRDAYAHAQRMRREIQGTASAGIRNVPLERGQRGKSMP